MMSLFQCQACGCCENTALTHCGYPGLEDIFDWSYAPERRGLQLCSACGPIKYSDGTKTSKCGGWHGEFERVYLPKDSFFTNKVGNLQHKQTGSERFIDFQIEGPDVAYLPVTPEEEEAWKELEKQQ